MDVDFLQAELWRDQLTEPVLALETKLARFQGVRYRVASPGHGAPRQDHGRLVRPGGHRLYTLSLANKQISVFDKPKIKSIRRKSRFSNQYRPPGQSSFSRVSCIPTSFTNRLLSENSPSYLNPPIIYKLNNNSSELLTERPASLNREWTVSLEAGCDSLRLVS